MCGKDTDKEVTNLPCSCRGDVQRPRVEDGRGPVATLVIFRVPVTKTMHTEELQYDLIDYFASCVCGFFTALAPIFRL